MTDTNYRAETWIDRAENMFSFAESAKERFERGTPAEKRYVLSCLGTNILLKDRQIRVAWHKGLALFEDISATVEGIHNEKATKTPDIRTKKRPPQRRQLEEAYAQNKTWGGRGDSNPRPPDPQSGALTD